MLQRSHICSCCHSKEMLMFVLKSRSLLSLCRYSEILSSRQCGMTHQLHSPSSFFLFTISCATHEAFYHFTLTMGAVLISTLSRGQRCQHIFHRSEVCLHWQKASQGAGAWEQPCRAVEAARWWRRSAWSVFKKIIITAFAFFCCDHLVSSQLKAESFYC